MFKVAIVGCGGIAQPHVTGWQAIPSQAQITALCDVNSAGVEKYAQMLGNKPVRFDDFKTLVKKADIDAVDICLPHHLHKDAIIAAAEAGKHILCEKPLCLTIEEAEAVTRAVTDAGVTLMCAHNQLFLPTVAAARQMVRDGRLGKVYGARTTDIFSLTIGPDRLGWRARRATSGGGELIDTGYHPTYLLLHLIDSVQVREAALLSRQRLGR